MLYHDCIMFFSIVNMINHDYIHAYHPMAAVGEVHDDGGCGDAPNEKSSLRNLETTVLKIQHIIFDAILCELSL